MPMLYFHLRSLGKVYDLDEPVGLLVLKIDLMQNGFFDIEENKKLSELFDRAVAIEELREFVRAVNWWEYPRIPRAYLTVN